MNSNGYLNQIGWINSYKKMMPVDNKGNPLPWVTYPFIDFIESRLNRSMEIFEYGSGNSTLWYADKVKYVTSVEHDQNWYEKVKNNLPDNTTIHYSKLVYGKEYCQYAKQLDKKFDLIIVDGRDRVNCIKNSIECLTSSGVIILDDSERSSYLDGIQYLIDSGFKKIDFWGISPGLFYKKNTTVFYKNNNCLGI
jgi:hypothetical protein